MKAKFKFDKKTILDFSLRHGEKFIFALVVLGLLVFVYGALRVEGYDKRPDDIERVASEKERLLTPSDAAKSADAAAEEIPDPNVVSAVKKITEDIDGEFYRHQTLWTPFLFEQRPKRGEPRLFPVTDVRGEPGHGSIRLRPNPLKPLESKTVVGRRWIVVTGLIPMEEQYKEYLDLFENAQYYNPENDIPKVLYYNIERAESSSPDADEQPNWQKLSLNTELRVVPGLPRPPGMADAEQVWEDVGAEIVAPQFIHQGGSTPVAFPLPALRFKTFGKEAAHPPEIPLLAETAAREQREAEMERFNEMLGARGKGPADAPPVGNLDLPPELAKARQEEVAVEEEVETIPYRLFRFIDFNVKPGKYYRYRFKLWLYNPNYGVELKFLERDELRDSPYLLTEWSEPTDVIAMPRDTDVLVASVKPPPGGRVTLEPKATVGVSYFFMETGDELFEEQEVVRGRHLNFPERKLPEGMAPVAETPVKGGDWIKTFGKTEQTPKEPEKKTVDFITDAVLLDMLGGERLPGKDRDLTEPGKLLVLDADGNLIVKDELEDADKFPTAEEAATQRQQQRAVPGKAAGDLEAAMDEEEPMMEEPDMDDAGVEE